MTMTQSIEPSNELIRTARHGVYAPKVTSWGAYYQQIPDPLANAEEAPKLFELRPDLTKIPYELWSAVIDLYFHYAAISNLEVSVLLLRDAATKQKWKVVVPQQTVSAASVHAEFDDCIDLLTGEEYQSFPPDGWLHAGSSHSHHTMSVSFSSVDDANELDVPGAHVLVRSVDLAKRTYIPDASIVQQRHRYLIPAANLIELAGESPSKAHPNVHKFVQEYVPTYSRWTGTGTMAKGKPTTVSYPLKPRTMVTTPVKTEVIAAELDTPILKFRELVATLVADHEKEGLTYTMLHEIIDELQEEDWEFWHAEYAMQRGQLSDPFYVYGGA